MKQIKLYRAAFLGLTLGALAGALASALLIPHIGYLLWMLLQVVCIAAIYWGANATVCMDDLVQFGVDD